MKKMICKCYEESFSGTDKSIKKYVVIRGIFKDHVFNGHEVIISGQKRIWDDDSIGRSYLKQDTRPYPYIEEDNFSGRIVDEDLARTSPCHKVESVRFFKKGIAGSLDKEQIRDYCFEKD